jgi:hypothetical protein
MPIDLPPPPKLYVPARPAIIRASDLPRTYAEAKKIATREAVLPGMVGLWGGLGLATVSYIGAIASATNLTDYSAIGSFNLTAYPNSYIAIAAQGNSTLSRALSNAAITGQSFTQRASIVNAGASPNLGAIWVSDSPLTLGSGQTIDLNFTGGMANAAASVFAISNLTSPVPVGTGSDTGANANGTRTTGSFDVPLGGVVIALAMTNTATASAWTGATQNANETVESTIHHRTASEAYPNGVAGHTVQATNAYYVLAASWGP